jgi:hypothetical protein
MPTTRGGPEGACRNPYPAPATKAGAGEGQLHTNEGSFNEHDFQRQPHVGMTSEVVLGKPPPLPKGNSWFSPGAQ